MFSGPIFTEHLLPEAKRRDQRHRGLGIKPMKQAWV